MLPDYHRSGSRKNWGSHDGLAAAMALVLAGTLLFAALGIIGCVVAWLMFANDKENRT